MFASKWRLDLARKVAGHFSRHPQVKAIEVLGSVASRTADDHSDVDIMTVWDAPDFEALREPSLTGIGAIRHDLVHLPREGECFEHYSVGNLRMDIRHIKLASLTRTFDGVLGGFDIDGRRQVLIWLILWGEPLYGASLIERLKARARSYPDGLAVAMITHHAAFYPADWLDRLLLRRSHPLLAQHTICRTAENVLGILLGLNRLYGSVDVGKLFDRWIDHMRLCPARFRARLDEAVAAPPSLGVRLVSSLVHDTLALVGTHMPDVDLRAVAHTFELPARSCAHPPPVDLAVEAPASRPTPEPRRGWVAVPRDQERPDSRLGASRPASTSPPPASASQWRLDLAGRLASYYRRAGSARAVGVLGSVASGTADDYSDLDLIVYWEDSTLAALEDVSLSRLGASRVAVHGDPAKQECVELYLLDDLSVDVSHMTVRAVDQLLADVLERHSTDAAKQGALSCLIDGLPLQGADFFEAARTRATVYPPGLARAMVEDYAFFYPRGMFEKLVVGRGNLLFAYQLICQSQENILGVLLGLNRRYGPPTAGKLFEPLIQSLTIAPGDLARRFRQIWSGPSDLLPRTLDGLILETLALVERHMPEVDLTRLRRVYELDLNACQEPPVIDL